jgi:hypothetical protein
MRIGNEANSSSHTAKKPAAIRVTSPGTKVSVREVNSVTYEVVAATETSALRWPWRDDPAERFRLATGTRKGAIETGSGSGRQNRTKPPASGGRKTDSPDCKVKAA